MVIHQAKFLLSVPRFEPNPPPMAIHLKTRPCRTAMFRRLTLDPVLRRRVGTAAMVGHRHQPQPITTAGNHLLSTHWLSNSGSSVTSSKVGTSTAAPRFDARRVG
jgi:hypothetical protein